MEYNVGDKVRIRPDLGDHRAYRPTGCRKSLDEYSGTYIVSSMVRMSGETVTIAKRFAHPYGGEYYHIEEDGKGFYWVDTMFCSISADAPSFKTLL